MNKLNLAMVASAALLQLSGANVMALSSASPIVLSVQEIHAKTLQPYEGSRDLYRDVGGEYLLDAGGSLRLSQFGRRFFVEVNGQPKIEVRASSANAFVTVAGDIELAFERHANGLVSRLVLTRAVEGRT
jgi:hypothetical protein